MASWPLGSDYQTAVQNPKTVFQDKDLQDCTVRPGAMGLPWVASGNFASVFCLIHPSGQKYAARVFNRQVTVQKQRYQAISDHLGGIIFGFMVSFEYQEQGIQVAGAWYPIIKMDWVDGVQFGRFVEDNIANPDVLRFAAGQFRAIYSGLQGATMSHCDFQHGNIMINSRGDLILVDYDDFYVPSLTGESAIGLGMPNYQHPARTGSDFDEKIDNFAALVIYMSLGALAADQSLFQKYNNGDNLVLKESDYKDMSSKVWLDLAHSPEKVAVEMTDIIRQACQGPVNKVPSLEQVLKQTGVLPPGKRPVVQPVVQPTVAPRPTPLPTTQPQRVPIAVLPVSQHNFGRVSEGESSAPWDFEIKNQGQADLIVQAINPSDPQQFSVSYNPRPISPAGTLIVSVEFSPQVVGAVNATLAVDTNDKPLIVNVRGQGVEKPKPQIVLSELSHDFESVLLGGGPQEWQVEIDNIGQGDLQNLVLSYAVPEIKISTWPQTIPAGDDATITVSYAPTQVGDLDTIIEITSSNAPRQEIRLVGQATDKGIRRVTTSAPVMVDKNILITVSLAIEGAGFAKDYVYSKVLREVTTTTSTSGPGRGRKTITRYEPVDDPATGQEQLPSVSTNADGVTFAEVRFVSSSLLKTEMTVSPGCQPGKYNITVTNPGPSGERFVGRNLLEIQALPADQVRCWKCKKLIPEYKPADSRTQFCPYCKRSQSRPVEFRL